MAGNINTKSYWDARFESDDWEAKAGRQQTQQFAREQCRRMALPGDFAGIITDFGCGLGDAMPVYRDCFPRATLRGCDFSTEAIKKCRERYGEIATFSAGEAGDVADSDVIIASNVFEHLSDETTVLNILLQKCKLLYVVVPYREKLGARTEHVNTYDENSFDGYARSVAVYRSAGMGERGLRWFCNIWIKNPLRLLAGKPLVRNSNRQVMYVFTGLLGRPVT